MLYIWKQSVSFEINNDVNFTGKQLGLFFFELTSGDKETKQKWAPWYFLVNDTLRLHVLFTPKKCLMENIKYCDLYADALKAFSLEYRR